MKTTDTHGIETYVIMEMWYSFLKLCSYKTIYDYVYGNSVKSIEKEKLHVPGK